MSALNGDLMHLNLADMHCHLDFSSDALGIARNARWRMLTMTVNPRDYERVFDAFTGFANIQVAAGLHPWWVADGTCGLEEVDLLCQLASRTRFIGEVGLDFSKRHEGSENAQITAFDRIVAACAREGERVLSIHALRSTDTVLDVLEKHGAASCCTCIMHWFSGSAPQLARAIQLGCMFSLNDRMMATGKGREYAKVIPADRILLETDLPSREGEICSAQMMMDSLQEALLAIEQARMQPLQETIATNADRVFGLAT